MKKLSYLILAILLTLTGLGVRPARAVASIIYVNDNASVTPHDGTSWTNAYKNLQNALDAAGPGDQIWVAAGVYYPDEGSGHINNDRAESFELINGVAIYGGFIGGETQLGQRKPAINIAILSGDLEQNDVDPDNDNIIEHAFDTEGINSRHVVTSNGVDDTAILNGFTITAGNGNFAGTMVSPDAHGAGMYNVDSSPTLANLNFIGNFTGYGGGMSNLNSSPTITNVKFEFNMGYQYGGGMFNQSSAPSLNNVTVSQNNVYYEGGGIYNYLSAPSLTNVAFNYNIAAHPTSEADGGGMVNRDSSPTMLNVAFNGNATQGYGGGLYNYGDSDPTLTNVTFFDNRAHMGGGMATKTASVPSDHPEPILENVTFDSNQADYGGGIYGHSSNTVINNSLFKGNYVLYEGAGIFIDTYSDFQLTNVTFAALNQAIEYGAAMAIKIHSNPTLTNVTITGNGATFYNSLYVLDQSHPTLINTLITGNEINVGECYFDGTSSINPASSNNLITEVANGCGLTHGVNGNIIGVTPSMGPLQNNGGVTETHALLAGSRGIDEGTNTGCPATDQRGKNRPINGDNSGSATCDIGAYELDPTPTVASILRADPSPTNAASVDFTVIFSESVTGVDSGDFLLTTTSVSGAAVSGVSGSGDTRTVTVNAGSGSGTIRLDVKSSGTSIIDATSAPLSGGFTSGQSYTVDKTAPAVLSISRADENPTANAAVEYIVAFSEPVTGVDIGDFSLSGGGASGANVSEFNGSGANYTVTVDTGSGNTSFTLNLKADGTGIVDALGNAKTGGVFPGQKYNVDKNETFRSQGVNDGWVLESGEISNVGGSFDSTASVFRLGDDAHDRQYRAILDFDTSSLPDSAVIDKVILKIKQAGIQGTNPFVLFSPLRVDIRKPRFGSSVALASNDFQAAASQANIGAIPNTSVSGWYTKSWNAGAFFTYINLSGSTQFRLYFAIGDDDDNLADYMKFFSGNAASGARPQLIIEYHVP